MRVRLGYVCCSRSGSVSDLGLSKIIIGIQ